MVAKEPLDIADPAREGRDCRGWGLRAWPLPAPSPACAIGANTAVALAAAAGDPLGVVQRVRAYAEAGIRFVAGGDRPW